MNDCMYKDIFHCFRAIFCENDINHIQICTSKEIGNQEILCQRAQLKNDLEEILQNVFKCG